MSLMPFQVLYPLAGMCCYAQTFVQITAEVYMITTLATLLTRQALPGVYVVSPSIAAAGLKAECDAADMHFYLFEGQEVYTDAQFWQRAIQSFEFPTITGDSWDAFYDRAVSMPWVSSYDPGLWRQGIVILYASFSVFAQNNPSSFAYALEVLEEAREPAWREGTYPTYILLAGSVEHVPETVVIQGRVES